MSDETQRSRMVQASQVLEAVRSLGRAAIEYRKLDAEARGASTQEFRACNDALAKIETLAVRLVRQGSTEEAAQEVSGDELAVY